MEKFFFEHATRTINDNNFLNLNQLLTSSFSSSMSCVTNIIVYRDDKLLNRKHIIVKTLQIRSKKYVLSRLHTFENKCSHCFVYQYNEKCYEKSSKSKYWHCCFDDKIFNELFIVESDFICKQSFTIEWLDVDNKIYSKTRLRNANIWQYWKIVSEIEW